MVQSALSESGLEPSSPLLRKLSDRHGIDAGQEDEHPQAEEKLMIFCLIEYDY